MSKATLSRPDLTLLRRRSLHACAFLVLAGAWSSVVSRPALVVIGHPDVPRLDAEAVLRLYMGRAFEVGGKPITVVDLPAHSALRERFLVDILKTDAQRYAAYWTVRRHVGKGVPPRVLDSEDALVQFVCTTPGAVGYAYAATVKPGMNIVFQP